MLSKLISVIFIVLASFGVSIWYLVYGWGLQPQNWSVIVCSFVLTIILQSLIVVIGKESDKN